MILRTPSDVISGFQIFFKKESFNIRSKLTLVCYLQELGEVQLCLTSPGAIDKRIKIEGQILDLELEISQAARRADGAL
jgi:hypothetical protein